MHTDLVLGLILMIHLSVELVTDKVAEMQAPLRTSLLGIALVQVNRPLAAVSLAGGVGTAV